MKLNYVYPFYKNKTKEKYLYKRRYKLIHGDKMKDKIKKPGVTEIPDKAIGDPREVEDGVKYAKAIEDLVEEIKKAVKELDKQSELLKQHPDFIPIPLEKALEGKPTLLEILEERTQNSERALRKLKEKLDKLYEKLEEGEKYNKNPKTISGLIAKIVVEKAVADAKETTEEANKAIDRSKEAFYKFKEYWSQDDIRRRIQEENEREKFRVEEMRMPYKSYIDPHKERPLLERFIFFDELLKSGYPQERIYKDSKEELHLAELEISDKYEPVKAEIKKNLETPDKLVEFEKSEDPIVRGILAGSLRVTPNMPKELVKKIVEIAEALGNDPHWYVRAKLLENKKLEYGLWFRARDVEVNQSVAFFNAVRDAENTNIKDIYENFEKLREKLKNDDPDWRVRIKAIS